MARMPDPWKSLSDRIYRIEEALKRLQNGSPFSGTGVHPNGSQGLDSDNYIAGSSGFSLNGGTGNAEFNDLTLRGGIIGNDALTNPLEPARAHADAVNYAVPNSFGTVMSVTVPVPDGFTRALLLSLAIQASALNTSASIGWMYATGHIAGYSFGGWTVGSPDTSPGKTAVTYDLTTQLLTGLSGSFTIEGQLSTNGGGTWSASAVNVANMDASILFLR